MMYNQTTTAFLPETMQLRDELLGASPYLSDTVMVNAAEKEDVLPNSIITEVLSENPQSAKAENVLNALNSRNNPPNDNQMAQIHANDTVLGHKEKLESKRAFYGAEKTRFVYDLVRFYLSDTTNTAIYDSIAEALDNINTQSARYQAVFCRYNKGDSVGVVNILAQIPSEFDLTTNQTDYHNYFVDYFNILLTLKAQGKTFDETDSTQKAVLYTIMNNTYGILQTYARNILIKTDGFVYNEPYLLLDTTNNKSDKIKSNDNFSLWDSDKYFSLYPNPAGNYITIEYNLNYVVVNPVVEIISLSGKHVNTFRLQKNRGVKIIDLRDYVPGSYIIRLSNNGNTLQTGKFVKL